MQEAKNLDFAEPGQQAPEDSIELDNGLDPRRSGRQSAASVTSLRSRASVKPPAKNEKPKFTPRETVWRRHISKEYLLPTVNGWRSTWTRHKRVRRLFLLLNLSVVVCLFISRIVAASIIANHMKEVRSFTAIHTLPRGDSSVEDKEAEKLHFLLTCAAVYPRWTGVKDWYAVEDIPYAALPRRTAVHTLKKLDPNSNQTSLILRPILVYVGGDSMLFNRPRLISARMAAKMDFVYVTIRYRLGVFGFSDYQMDEAGPNHAVEDVKRALNWVYENAALFGGDARQITLFGENSGATIAALLMNAQLETFETTNTSQPYLFSRLWLSDGGLVAPPKSSDLNPFQKLLLSDLELTEACFKKRREGRIVERTNGSSSSISGKVACLEGAIPDTNDREALNARFRDIPMVISSTMDQVDLHMSRRNKPSAKNMTLLELQNELRASLSTLSSSTAQVNYVYSIGKAYDALLRTLSKTNMGEAFNAIVSDLRNHL
ncbi:unnamed protein product [Dibothriocephalus latus]|uniref:Carboxylesterase type B domain-containing protein n=1 Tax=Dibothriocephalus latus TaxID=60516 RepID=A0A3P7MC47_DIBLA|nr:unnamed protein product [Dibothriocephalus latus]